MLSMYDKQINAIRKGFVMHTTNISITSMPSWSALERSVCGDREISVELLKKNVSNEGVSEETEDMFWRVMESFTAKEKADFLRFTWGRSRLPVNPDGWEFRLVPKHHATPDKIFPTSHTCFNTLDLPAYSSTEVMREKLLYAIENCTTIDTDFNVR